MSNGPVEEAGKVATSAIDSLRGSPGLLTVVILQMITLAALVYISQTNRQNQQTREMYLLEKCLDGEHLGKDKT